MASFEQGQWDARSAAGFGGEGIGRCRLQRGGGVAGLSHEGRVFSRTAAGSLGAGMSLWARVAQEGGGSLAQGQCSPAEVDSERGQIRTPGRAGLPVIAFWLC